MERFVCLVVRPGLGRDTFLLKIGTSLEVIERLVEMLNWKDTREEEIRISAAEILSSVASKKQHSLRVKALQVPLLRIGAARILCNLCAYSGKETHHLLCGITEAAPTVLKGIVTEENKLQEVMVGLAVHIFKLIYNEKQNEVFVRANITEADLTYTLVCILKKNQYPPARIPQIRRFSIELAILMMQEKKENVHLFRDLGLNGELYSVLETTAETENFNIFSGTVGLSRHSRSIHSLVDTDLKLLQEK